MTKQRGERHAGGSQLVDRIDDAPARQPEVLRQFEICQRLGVSDDTWRRWVRSRQAPAPVPNVPGRPRWLLSEIEAFERGAYRAGRRVFFGAARRAS